MGLAASQARLLLLTAKNDALELVAQQIENERLILAQEQELIAQEYTDATSNNYMYVRVNDPKGAGTTQESLTLDSLAKSMQGRQSVIIADANGDPLVRATADNTSGEWVVTYDIIINNTFLEKTDLEEHVQKEKENNILKAKATDVLDVAEKKYAEIEQEHKRLENLPNKTDADKAKETAYSNALTPFKNAIDAYKQVGTNKVTEDDIATLSEAMSNAINPTLGTEFKMEDGQAVATEGEGYTYSFDSSSFDNSTDFTSFSLEDPAEGVSDSETYQELKRKTEIIIDQLNVPGAGTMFQNGVENGGFQILVQDTSDTANANGADITVGNQFYVRKSFDALTNGSSRYYTEDDAAAQAKYDTAMAKVNALDTKLENRLNQVETQKKAVEQEMESVDSIIKSNIERTFKYFG